MTPTLLYLTCLLGAVGLYLLVRPTDGMAPAAWRGMRTLGLVLGLGAFAWLATGIADAVAPADGGGGPGAFTVIFGLVAVVSAVRMISTGKPVYAALHFVLVILASAGMFLMLEAEFMAFALIIVYAGAILITYIFVLMLSQQSPDPDDPEGQSEYDRTPREPAAGALVAFLLLALLTRTVSDGVAQATPRLDATEARIEAWQELEGMPGRLERWVERLDDASLAAPLLARGEDGRPMVEPSADGLTATVLVHPAPGETPIAVEMPADLRPENVQRVGLGLIVKFPASLEIAGVILLMAMFGAVLLARRQIELTEDEKRQAAGLEPLGEYEPRPDARDRRPNGGEATA